MLYDTPQLRNIVLLGHSGSGKTSFAECMLYEAKAITRRGKITEGTTVSDFTALEQLRGHSIFAKPLHVDWKNTKLNILDTPGSDDFIGEWVSSLKVADTSVMMLNATAGVEVGTELMWEYIQAYNTPTIFVINHLDQAKADYENTLFQAKTRFGNKVIAVQYPTNTGDGFHNIIDVLRMVMYKFHKNGGKPEKFGIPASEIIKARAMHQVLVEIAAENDEELMSLFFDNETLTEEELTKGLRIAMANQSFYPVFCASAAMNMGSGRIMGFLHDLCPAPNERAGAKLANGSMLPCDSKANPAVFIFKTMSEPNVGLVSYFKVCSGTLKVGDELVNEQTQSTERFSQLFIANGKTREAVTELRAGDIGACLKLKNAHTNNTLHLKGQHIEVDPIHYPSPRMRVAVTTQSKNDVEKLARALHSIQEEDPTVLVEHDMELKQTILLSQGQMHLDTLKYRIEKVFGVEIQFEKTKIPYRETITQMVNHSYRHKKQSGGAGQFGEVHLRIEPFYEGMPAPQGLNVRATEEHVLPWGGKLVFNNCIVGGVVDARFMSAIQKGIMQKMIEGPLTGSHVRDIRCSVYDGKMHDVDSNDMAFQIAGAQCFKEAFTKAAPQILEPIHTLNVLCAADSMGDVIGDLQNRRAIIMGMDSEGLYQKVSARVPLATLNDYSKTLRAITQGRAKFDMHFLEYQIVSADVQAQLIEAHKRETMQHEMAH